MTRELTNFVKKLEILVYCGGQGLLPIKVLRP